jgi:glycine/D-amino acid oxidase-like deaminating enzyme
MLFASAWDDGQWQSLPALDTPVECDVCVIGLGGSGLAAVEAAVEAGLRVIGIDATQVAGGAAGRNGGFLLAGFARFYHQMVAAIGRELAAELYRHTLLELSRLSAHPDVRLTGSLRIADTDKELADCEAHYAALRADGFQVERYEGAEGRGLLIPTDGVFNPLARARALARDLLAKGARLFERTPAVAFDAGKVTTPDAVIECNVALVAIDGRLESLFPELQGRIRTARLQMLATEPTGDITLTRPVYARWGYDYWQQLQDGRIVLGGARDHAEADEWTTSIEPTAPVQRALEVILRERLHVRARITHRWAASVGYTPHGMPLVTELRPHLWIIGGYNGTGNIVGAVCARAVIERLYRGRPQRLDLLQRAMDAATRQALVSARAFPSTLATQRSPT